MRLFDKYLLACTNQRIPMPSAWQASMGLVLHQTKQEEVSEGILAENTGYLFQRDDVLTRGYIAHLPRTSTMEQKEIYVTQMYLQALFDHTGEDYRPYFLLSTSVLYEHPHYVVTAPIVIGQKYSIYGATLLPSTVEIYSEASRRVLYSEEIDSLSYLAQKVIDTSRIIDLPVGEEEYFVLRVRSFVAVNIVHGVYNRLPLSRVFCASQGNKKLVDGAVVLEPTFTAQTVMISSPSSPVTYYPAALPSIAYSGQLYADKLVPSLLGMNVTKNSSPVVHQLVGEDLLGNGLEEKVLINTLGLYDVDEYMGSKLVW